MIKLYDENARAHNAQTLVIPLSNEPLENPYD